MNSISYKKKNTTDRFIKYEQVIKPAASDQSKASQDLL